MRRFNNVTEGLEYVDKLIEERIAEALKYPIPTPGQSARDQLLIKVSARFDLEPGPSKFDVETTGFLASLAEDDGLKQMFRALVGRKLFPGLIPRPTEQFLPRWEAIQRTAAY